jgi:DnaJ-class molecular chaperone
MNPFTVLGVSTNCDVQVAKDAYRKLAQRYHPDRETGNEAKFKEIKAAWEKIDGGYREPVSRPSSPGSSSTFKYAGHWADEFRQANRSAPNGQNSNFDFAAHEVNVDLRTAYRGFRAEFQRADGTNTTVDIPRGTPSGYVGKYVASDGRPVTVHVTIQSSFHKVRGLDNQNNLFSAGLQVGDVEIAMDVDAIDLITGTWVKVEDFLGEKLVVRVPAGFNPLHRLKVASKGYYGWLQEFNRPSNNRMDMFIKLNPIFNRPEDIERQKIIDLYKTVEGL